MGNLLTNNVPHSQTLTEAGNCLFARPFCFLKRRSRNGIKNKAYLAATWVADGGPLVFLGFCCDFGDLREIPCEPLGAKRPHFCTIGDAKDSSFGAIYIST